MLAPILGLYIREDLDADTREALLVFDALGSLPLAPPGIGLVQERVS
jgi:hypothetical protein